MDGRTAMFDYTMRRWFILYYLLSCHYVTMWQAKGTSRLLPTATICCPWRDVLRMFVDTFAITGNAKPSLPWILPMKRFGFIPYKVHCVIMEIIAAVFANLANLVNNQIIYAVCPCMLLKQLKTIGEYMLEIIKTFSARWIIARDYTLSCRRADARSDWQARMAVLVIRPSLFASHFRPSERHRFCMTE